MLTITISERRALRARAHELNPVVMIGQHGLTATVMREIERALDAHELIKVRVFNDGREAREALLHAICEELNCAPVQHIGKLLVLWRPKPEEEAPPVRRAAKKSTAKKRPFSGASKRLTDRYGQAIGMPMSAGQARNLHGEGRTSTKKPVVRKTASKTTAPRSRRRNKG